MKHRALRIWLACAPCAIIVAACAGSSSNGPGVDLLCDPGTVQRNGQCVPNDGGPNIRPDSDAASVDGTATDALLPDASEDVDRRDAMVAESDPCTPVPPLYNCNSPPDCGGGNYERCVRAACADAEIEREEYIYFSQATRGEHPVRTPLRPGFNRECARCGADGGDAFAYSIAFRIAGGFSIAVGAPWSIHLMNPGSRLKNCPSEMKESVGNYYATAQGPSDQFLLVATTDPDAPARNISFKLF